MQPFFGALYFFNGFRLFSPDGDFYLRLDDDDDHTAASRFGVGPLGVVCLGAYLGASIRAAETLSRLRPGRDHSHQ